MEVFSSWDTRYAGGRPMNQFPVWSFQSPEILTLNRSLCIWLRVLREILGILLEITFGTQLSTFFFPLIALIYAEKSRDAINLICANSNSRNYQTGRKL